NSSGHNDARTPYVFVVVEIFNQIYRTRIKSNSNENFVFLFPCLVVVKESFVDFKCKSEWFFRAIGKANRHTIPCRQTQGPFRISVSKSLCALHNSVQGDYLASLLVGGYGRIGRRNDVGEEPMIRLCQCGRSFV